MGRSLRNKKILVTAGPTWVPIDAVRVISNVSSGRTGVTIAEYAARKGADVTLLLGPVGMVHGPRSTVHSLKIIRFKYFDELKKIIEKELTKQKYDILIHGAAVSDYKPVGTFKQKIKSGKKGLKIFLKPTVKLIDVLRKRSRGALLVMFKLEVGRPKKELIEIAYKNMRRAKADLVVANNLEDITKCRHKAYVIDSEKRIVNIETKEELADKLFKIALKKL